MALQVSGALRGVTLGTRSWLRWPAVFWPHVQNYLNSWEMPSWDGPSQLLCLGQMHLAFLPPLSHLHLCSFQFTKDHFSRGDLAFFLPKPQGSPLSPAMKDVEFSETWILELPGGDLRTPAEHTQASGGFLLRHIPASASSNSAFCRRCFLRSSFLGNTSAFSNATLAFSWLWEAGSGFGTRTFAQRGTGRVKPSRKSRKLAV